MSHLMYFFVSLTISRLPLCSTCPSFSFYFYFSLGINASLISRIFNGILLQILQDVGVRTMRLMTNNPAKYVGLKGYGLAIIGRVPLLTPITIENRRYLETKREKMGHIYGSEDDGHVNGNSSIDRSSGGASET